MEKITQLKNYAIYLKFIQHELDNLFEKQKEYLCCEKGCGKCCKYGQFHYSEIEFLYLLTGFMQLDEEIQTIIELLKFIFYIFSYLSQWTGIRRY